MDGVLFIDRMDVAMRKLGMREIRASKWDVQMKMSGHRKTGRIVWHLARATALPHRLRRKLQVTGPRCGYWLVTIPSN
nr:hypothetical protein [Trebonia kvetii]